MSRKIEVRLLDGLPEYLDGAVLADPLDRLTIPSKTLENRINEAALAWLRERAVNQPHCSFAFYRWPANGPAHYGLMWAYNPRTNATLRQAFTETGQTGEHIVSWDEAEQHLMMFSLAQFGKPTTV